MILWSLCLNLFDGLQVEHGWDKSVDESGKNQKEKEFKPSHIVSSHTFANEDAVMVVAIDADIAEIAMLCVFFGGSVAFLAKMSENLHVESGTWLILDGCLQAYVQV